jgi:hypothetical protein
MKIEKRKTTASVVDDEIRDYCQEFIGTFQPLIEEELFINADWNIDTDFVGAMVKFTISKEKRLFNQDKSELIRFLPLIEKYEVEGYTRRKFFEEEKIKFYDDKKLFIYKSNQSKDWTQFMAIEDANEEVELFFHRLRTT